MISLITRGSADHGRHCGAADIHRMLKMLRCPDVNLAAEYESEASYCGAAFRCRRRPIGGPTQDRQGARPRNTGHAARPRRPGDRMRRIHTRERGLFLESRVAETSVVLTPDDDRNRKALQSGLPCQVQHRRSGSVQSFNCSRSACIGNRLPRPGGHQRDGYPAGRFAASLNNAGCRNGRTT